MGLEGFVLTEEKVRKLLPIVEQILSRKYGRDLELKNLTMGGITVEKEEKKRTASSN